MDLTILWFILITVLFTGFFILEGFDYGVGMLLPFLSRRDEDRSQVLMTIAPVWDGNEVWMITAGGALFAAFPHVYATMFSTFYLALFLMLVALILRGAAFELRGRSQHACWRRAWEAAICFGSALPAFLWGVAVIDLLKGLPINQDMTYAGSFFDLLSIYSIVGGITFLAVFVFHGATFLSIRLQNTGLILRARSLARVWGIIAAAAFVLCLLLTVFSTDIRTRPAAVGLLVLAALLFIGAYIRLCGRHYVSSFVLGALTIACTTVGFFAALFPRLMVSSLNPAYSLTITNAASTPYTLSIMTVAALVLVPIVLIYQGWTYYVFRHRITPDDVQEHSY